MRLIIVAAVLLATILLGTGVASADGSSPYHLQQIGWTCANVPNTLLPDGRVLVQGVHCFPPPLSPRTGSIGQTAGMALVFDTTDPNAQEASVKGMEILIPADRYHGEPCPQNGLEEYLSTTLPNGAPVRTCHHFYSILEAP